MKSWIAFAILGFALAQSGQKSKCPTYCDCVVSGEAICTTLDIEPFETDDIHTLTIKTPKTRLDLTGAAFTTLRLTKLSALIVENATINRLTPDLFTSTHLEKFIVRHSKVPVVDKQLFKDAKHIRQVDISYSDILIFQGIHSPILDELVLESNNFTHLPDDSLSPKDLPALSYISLAGNSIKEVKLGNIAGEQINLSNNKIRQLLITSEEDLDRIVTLRLDGNPLNTISSQDDVDIEELYVNDCDLTTMAFLTYFTSLVKLEANNNLIWNIDAQILNKLDALEALHLSQNLIREIPPNFGRLMSLTSLVLDKNNLKTLPKFMFQGALNTFSCNECNLTELHPETFKQMESTREISLNKNLLASIPKDLFRPVLALTKLDLTLNQLTELPEGLFEHNHGLQNVALGGNPIGKIDPRAFLHTDLKELHVDSCKLRQLWSVDAATLKKTNALLPKLKIVTATNNNITELKSSDLLVAKPDQLNLLNNPLSCSEDNIQFIDQMSKLNVNFLHSADCNTDSYDDSEASDYTDPLVEDDQSKELDGLPEDSNILSVLKSEGNDKLDDDMYDEDEDEDDDDDDDDDEDVDASPAKKNQQRIDEFIQDANDVAAIESGRFGVHQRSSRQMLLFVLPTLVFVLTAMVVLLLTVTVILCVLQKRNGRPTNAPQITILPWGHAQKIKKHSGSIYRPLSEEKIPV